MRFCLSHLSPFSPCSHARTRSRDDKRYTEKKNKSERARRKKEDTARLRGIVDTALAVDPRIKRIKEEEKAAREAKKKGKAGAGGAVSAKAKAEEARVALRGVRRHGVDAVKKAEKDKEIGEDDVRSAEKQLDALTKKYEEQVNELLKAKEAELMEV